MRALLLFHCFFNCAIRHTSLGLLSTFHGCKNLSNSPTFSQIGITDIGSIFLVCNKIRVMVMVFNATFNNISAISHGGQCYWWRKPEDPEKTTDMSQVTDKLRVIT